MQGGTHEAILWPPAAAEMWSAIAGLRGSHDAPPAGASGGAGPGRVRRRTALLLEGPVTLARARKAAASAAPRNWIVERARSVRIGPAGLRELRELGIRWSVIEPVEVVALAASPLLARARARWARMLPAGTTVWPIGSR